MLDDKLGRFQAIFMWIGFNVTFFPMHILGLLGMPRRIATYYGGRGWEVSNLIATVGAFMIAASVLVFIWNCIKLRNAERAPADPWEGNTLEWKTASPPPEYNFAEIPTVSSDRPLYDERMRVLEH
jgi:cytochrome c oxidase subunit 1